MAERKHNMADYLKIMRELLRENMVDYLLDLFCNEQTGFDMAEQLIVRLHNVAHKAYLAKYEKEVRFGGNKKTGWDETDDPIYRFIEDYTIYKFTVEPVLKLKLEARKKRELGGRKMDLLNIYDRVAMPEWIKQCEVLRQAKEKKAAQRLKDGQGGDRETDRLVKEANSGNFEARKQLEPNIKK